MDPKYGWKKLIRGTRNRQKFWFIPSVFCLFFPRNNENRFKSIPRNIFGTEFRWQPSNPKRTRVKNHRRGIWYGWSMGRPLNLIFKSIFLRGSHCTRKRLQKTVSTCTVHNVSIVKILFLKNKKFIKIWKVHIYVQCTMHNKYIQSNIVKMRRLRGWCRHWWSSTGPKGGPCTQGHIPPFFSLSNKLLWGERGGTVYREPQTTYYSE